MKECTTLELTKNLQEHEMGDCLWPWITVAWLKSNKKKNIKTKKGNFCAALNAKFIFQGPSSTWMLTILIYKSQNSSQLMRHNNNNNHKNNNNNNNNNS